jgi:hypothetical protein
MGFLAGPKVSSLTLVWTRRKPQRSQLVQMAVDGGDCGEGRNTKGEMCNLTLFYLSFHQI